MINFIYTLIIVLFLSTSLSAEILKKIEVKGNERITKETIEVYADIKINQNYEKDDINDIIKKLYSTEFFENIEANFTNNILAITVKEYPVINQIIIEGENAEKFKKEIIKLIKSKKRGSYIKNNIAKDLLKIREIYKSLGYNLAEVDSKIIEYDENRVDLIFLVDRGEKIKISKN